MDTGVFKVTGYGVSPDLSYWDYSQKAHRVVVHTYRPSTWEWRRGIKSSRVQYIIVWGQSEVCGTLSKRGLGEKKKSCVHTLSTLLKVWNYFKRKKVFALGTKWSGRCGGKFFGGFLLGSLVISVVNTPIPSGFQVCFALSSLYQLPCWIFKWLPFQRCIFNCFNWILQTPKQTNTAT